MKFSILVSFISVFIFGGFQAKICSQTRSSVNDSTNVERILEVFVGEWEGHATAYFPRNENRSNREETVSAVCTKVLGGNYIQCITNWTQQNGQSRELYIYFNYDKRNEVYKVLFLYDDWGEIVQYPITFDSENNVFRGVDTFTTSKGIKGEEHVEWWFSEDGNEIRGKEFNHYETDQEDYWPQSFDFVWKRK